MGFWSHRQYRTYVEAHAGTERRELLHPAGERFSDNTEKGQWRFRASHGALGEDETPQGANALLQGGDADWFLRNVQKVNLPPRQLMENFKSGQPEFYNKLAHLPPDRPKFNPVRQYFEEQKGKFAM
jgi:hypothetical protein